MGLLFAAKFCFLCHKSTNTSEKATFIENMAEQISRYEDFWINNYWGEDVSFEEFNIHLDTAVALEKACVSCDGEEPKVYSIIWEGENLANQILENEMAENNDKNRKLRMKRLKLKVDGNIYRSSLFRQKKKLKKPNVIKP
jgi:hypothetical protein